jgi:hypothetical protein
MTVMELSNLMIEIVPGGLMGMQKKGNLMGRMRTRYKKDSQTLPSSLQIFL